MQVGVSTLPITFEEWDLRILVHCENLLTCLFEVRGSFQGQACLKNNGGIILETRSAQDNNKLRVTLMLIYDQSQVSKSDLYEA